MTEITALSSGDLLKLTTGELVTVVEIERTVDGLMTLQLQDGLGTTWSTAPMLPNARIQGRIDRR